MVNERRRLLGRIERKYRLVSALLEFGDLKIDFTRIADPNRVLDELAEAEDRREKVEGKRREGDELHLPYWAELWDSALALGEELVGMRIESSDHLIIESLPESPLNSFRGSLPMIQCSDDLTIQFQECPHPNPLPAYRERGQEKDLAEKAVLDLGCGMGLAGTVAAALGAKVTLGDLESDALLVARLNAMQFDSGVRAIRVNWRTDDLGERFDWIVGADIIYERAQWQYLETFWRKHLKPGGLVLIGEPNRPGGDAFGEWIDARGWSVDISQRVASKTQKRIRMMRISRSNCASP